MDQIPHSFIQNCDIQSKAYCKAFNELVREDPQKLNDRDLSYLGLFLCKCVEEEVNSSIVQLIRQVKGIEMPEYYCRKQQDKTVRAVTHQIERLGAKVKWADLNCSNDTTGNTLRMIPLGDSYHAMKNMLETPEGISMIDRYDFLNDLEFHGTWRKIIHHRNNIAHAGHITDRKSMEECYEACNNFFEKYMPILAKMKKELGWKPDQRYWEGSPDSNRCSIREDKADLTAKIVRSLPMENFGKTVIQNSNRNFHLELSCLMTTQPHYCEPETDNDIFYNGELVDIFEENGKHGLRHSTGEIIVKASFDHIFASTEKAEFILSIKDGKSGYIDKRTLQFSDRLMKTSVFDCYFFKTEGCSAFGIVNLKGEILAPQIIDSIIDQNYYGIICESAGYYGYLTRKGVWIDAEFDAIIRRGISHPLIFVLDGEEGRINEATLEFVPLDTPVQRAIR